MAHNSFSPHLDWPSWSQEFTVLRPIEGSSEMPVILLRRAVIENADGAHYNQVVIRSQPSPDSEPTEIVHSFHSFSDQSVVDALAYLLGLYFAYNRRASEKLIHAEE